MRHRPQRWIADFVGVSQAAVGLVLRNPKKYS
jgi:hypothetical protein